MPCAAGETLSRRGGCAIAVSARRAGWLIRGSAIAMRWSKAAGARVGAGRLGGARGVGALLARSSPGKSRRALRVGGTPGCAPHWGDRTLRLGRSRNGQYSWSVPRETLVAENRGARASREAAWLQQCRCSGALGAARLERCGAKANCIQCARASESRGGCGLHARNGAPRRVRSNGAIERSRTRATNAAMRPDKGPEPVGSPVSGESQRKARRGGRRVDARRRCAERGTAIKTLDRSSRPESGNTARLSQYLPMAIHPLELAP